jgi:Cof subfamily protein (haloacid dehalogenase superfamily)
MKHFKFSPILPLVPALTRAPRHHQIKTPRKIRFAARSLAKRYNGSMTIRLIALDIDGTLLDSSSSEVPQANLRAVEAAARRGIDVVLVTGRRFDFAMPIARQFGCPLTMIVNNGALVKSTEGHTYLRYLLPRDTAREVLAETSLFRRGAAVVFDRPCANQIIFEDIDWDDPQRRGYFLRNQEFIARISRLEDSLTEDPIQVMYTGPVEEMQRVEAALLASKTAACFSTAVTYYKERDFGLVDVIRRDCSKGSTLAAWTSRRGFTRGEVMAIGDNYNDREMLEFAGLPVVMANGVAALKTAGWRETLSNDDAGVAAAIEAYALGTS